MTSGARTGSGVCNVVGLSSWVKDSPKSTILVGPMDGHTSPKYEVALTMYLGKLDSSGFPSSLLTGALSGSRKTWKNCDSLRVCNFGIVRLRFPICRSALSKKHSSDLDTCYAYRHDQYFFCASNLSLDESASQHFLRFYQAASRHQSETRVDPGCSGPTAQAQCIHDSH
jgi:hypothetical protein